MNHHKNLNYVLQVDMHSERNLATTFCISDDLLIPLIHTHQVRIQHSRTSNIKKTHSLINIVFEPKTILRRTSKNTNT